MFIFSYKAVKTKDVKEVKNACTHASYYGMECSIRYIFLNIFFQYVHWMMYWIVFSIFNVFEVFADTFIGLWWVTRMLEQLVPRNSRLEWNII
jgi:hypothetical protein